MCAEQVPPPADIRNMSSMDENHTGHQQHKHVKHAETQQTASNIAWAPQQAILPFKYESHYGGLADCTGKGRQSNVEASKTSYKCRAAKKHTCNIIWLTCKCNTLKPQSERQTDLCDAAKHITLVLLHKKEQCCMHMADHYSSTGSNICHTSFFISVRILTACSHCCILPYTSMRVLYVTTLAVQPSCRIWLYVSRAS